MIVVLPDSKTVHNGSMYSSSVTTGDFEQYIARDVVQYIDSHYRTIPKRTSRGLVGHSMGGYGASRIGMKHSDVFGSLYIMSPCCMAPGPPDPRIPHGESARSVKSAADSAKLNFGMRAQLASAAAWSPNPKNPPLYLDLPSKDGVPQQNVLNRWIANAPLVFVHQYIGNLRQYRGIAIDVAIRTACAQARKNCTRSSIPTESRTRSRYTRALTQARSPSGFRTSSCLSSARISARAQPASKTGVHNYKYKQE